VEYVDKNPVDVLVKKASDLYPIASLEPHVYVVTIPEDLS
jgi:hypothetical protein